jgi:FADH2 O2-dependent halogenase
VLEGTRRSGAVRIASEFVIDASGPRGFLHRVLALPDAPLRWLPSTEGVYTHFENVERWDRLAPTSEPPPYPVDDAAVHHVFPDGWIWVLRFNNGITSAGAALRDSAAGRLRAFEGGAAWHRLLAELPSVEAQFRGARPERPFVHAPRLAFRSGRVHGSNWALLPSAAGVIDPLLSTGFPLTLLGLQRLLEVLLQTRPGAEREGALRHYAEVTLRELDVTERLVAALYTSMPDPLVFKRLSLLYFAAAAFSEAARRLGRPALAPGFLLHAHPHFGRELDACMTLASQQSGETARAALLAAIDRAIEPFDIAGLRDRARRDWYPVRAEDLVAGASKLEASDAAIIHLLERSGFTATSAATWRHRSG